MNSKQSLCVFISGVQQLQFKSKLYNNNLYNNYNNNNILYLIHSLELFALNASGLCAHWCEQLPVNEPPAYQSCLLTVNLCLIKTKETHKLSRAEEEMFLFMSI